MGAPNHGTVLTFQAILSRLDFIYYDKRPIHFLLFPFYFQARRLYVKKRQSEIEMHHPPAISIYGYVGGRKI